MKLKHRFPLFFSFLFSLLLAIVLCTIYFLFDKFRTHEFQERLSEKAFTTVKLLLEVKEVDNQVLKIIDRNSINKLYNEKILVLNDKKELIYSSIDDTNISISDADLEEIKKKKTIYRTNKEYDILGIYYDFENRDYFALIAADDKYGRSKLAYLRLLLLGAFIIGTALVWIISFLLSKKTLRPLDRLRKQMQEITTQNLTVQVEEPAKQDEIKALAQSFNQMLARIDKAYNNQKEFTSNASHELRTPIARIVMQLENLLSEEHLDEKVRRTLKSISEDTYYLSDIITSLLLLSKIENSGANNSFQKVRLDEIIFHVASKFRESHPDFKFHFDIENPGSEEISMEVDGDETLLKIAFHNLFKNAYLYSSNQTVQCIIKQYPYKLQLQIINAGDVPQTTDPSHLFQTFVRGSNAKSKPGTGIGLSIVQRILTYHKASMTYQTPDQNTNEISVFFLQPKG